MKKNKALFIVFFSLFIMILGATVIYAYFSNSHGEDKSFGIDPEIERIEVSDFKELFFVTQARNYNDISGAADITKKAEKPLR